MASVPEAACCYAALILQDGGIPITIATLVKAANVNVESCWPRLFAKLFEKYNIEDLITNVGAGGGGSAPVAAATPIAAAGGSDAGGERLMELPFHVIDGIFSRLPVKSLIRYGLLSRRCLLRLKDPRFIKLHLQSNTHSSVVFYQDFQLWSADLDSLHDPQKANHQVTQYSEIGPHNFKYMGYVILAGSCDGLICLYDDWDRILILWNMSTNEHLTKRFPDDSVKMLGFGYDPFDDDYKVVMGKRTLSDKYHELIFYSLRSSSWSGYKEMSFQGYDPTYSALCRGGINVEGALHWVQRNYESYVLLALDIHTAQCQVLPLPHDGEMALEVFRGHLCAMESYDPRNPKPMGFWVMKDYGIKESWTKLFSVPVFRNASSELHYDPRGSSKNGDELLLLIKECMLYSYNWKTGEARRVNISTSRQVLTCQQSLLPLTGYNDIIAV